MFFALDLQTHKNVTIILRFPKNKYFLERNKINVSITCLKLVKLL